MAHPAYAQAYDYYLSGNTKKLHHLIALSAPEVACKQNSAELTGLLTNAGVHPSLAEEAASLAFKGHDISGSITH